MKIKIIYNIKGQIGRHYTYMDIPVGSSLTGENNIGRRAQEYLDDQIGRETFIADLIVM